MRKVMFEDEKYIDGFHTQKGFVGYFDTLPNGQEELTAVCSLSSDKEGLISAYLPVGKDEKGEKIWNKKSIGCQDVLEEYFKSERDFNTRKMHPELYSKEEAEAKYKEEIKEFNKKNEGRTFDDVMNAYVEHSMNKYGGLYTAVKVRQDIDYAKKHESDEVGKGSVVVVTFKDPKKERVYQTQIWKKDKQEMIAKLLASTPEEAIKNHKAMVNKQVRIELKELELEKEKTKAKALNKPQQIHYANLQVKKQKAQSKGIELERTK